VAAIGIAARIKSSPRRADLINHRFFRNMVNSGEVTKAGVAIVLGQWWHPLHHFPVFLSRSVSVLKHVEQQSYIAEILNEELGEGDPARAHERIYLSTMETAGFSAQEVSQAPPLPGTARLVSGYVTGAEGALTALGCAYATEVADLAMVGGIGKLVRQVTGVQSLAWVDIHVNQEPNHVAKAGGSLEQELTDAEFAVVLAAAEAHWSDWCGFFEGVARAVEGEQSKAPVEAGGVA